VVAPKRGAPLHVVLSQLVEKQVVHGA
jgi:hypothetical protein